MQKTLIFPIKVFLFLGIAPETLTNYCHHF
jgi:hypothetical protein